MSVRFVAITLACCLVGCSRPGIRTINPDTVILAFGDSLTKGTGVGESHSYPAVLAGILGCMVINEGNSGERSLEGVSRLPRVLKKHEPDLVILCHGGNDFLDNGAEAEVGANLEQMIRLCKQSGADIVIVSVPKAGLVLKNASIYASVARKHNVPCEANSMRRVLSKSYLKSDYIHPNTRGYRMIAEALAEFIQATQQ